LYHFVLELIKLIDGLDSRDRVARIVGDQLLRSGTSILANYIEGGSASSKREFTNFFNISLKSANESKMWICLLRDTRRISSDKGEWFLKELEEIANIFASSILTLKGKRK